MKRRIPIWLHDEENLCSIARNVVNEAPGVRIHFVGGMRSDMAVETSGPVDERKADSRPAMLLTDLGMPEVCAKEAIDWLRSQAVLKDLPIVVLSEAANPAKVQKLMEAGASAYLLKPTAFCDTLKLLAQLQQWCWGAALETPFLLARSLSRPVKELRRDYERAQERKAAAPRGVSRSRRKAA